MIREIKCWFISTNDHFSDSVQIDLLRVLPFFLLHLACLLVFVVGVSPIAVFAALFSYCLRILSIGTFYHRYFSHRAFKTNRFWQFIFALIGISAFQRGPLWWVSHHRYHHAHSDQSEDPHSPIQHSFWWSHMGWFMSKKYYNYNEKFVRDLVRYPELRLLEKLDVFVMLSFCFIWFAIGHFLFLHFPHLHTNGFQMLVWSAIISTVCVFHATVSINSIGHRWGKRRYQTNDQSRNNWFLALLTFGEGWHNNHHHYPSSAAQGFFWWEIDVTYYFILLLEKLKIVSDVKKLPPLLLHSKKLS